MAPLGVYAILCTPLRDVAKRTQALACIVGAALTAAVLWLIGPVLLRLTPPLPFDAPWRTTLIHAALPEETLKLAALLLLWRSTGARSFRNILVLATGIACGFAAFENGLAVWYARQPGIVVLERLFFSIPAHMAYAAITAGVLAAGGIRFDWRRICLAWTAATTLHWAYDAALFGGNDPMVYALLAVSIAIVVLAWWCAIRSPPRLVAT